MRSPMQNHKKNLHVKNKPFHGSSYLEEHDNKGKLMERQSGRLVANEKSVRQQRKLLFSGGTSDESSCDMGSKHISNQNSPRKSKKNKENSRRKSLPRSPINQKSSNRNEEDKPSSLPGSLSRRKPPRHNHLGPEDVQNKRYR